MKRLLILLLVFALCLCGCKKEPSVILPGGEEAPEGVDWKAWEQYIPYTMTMGEETVDVLIGLDAIHLAVYYDKEEQELMGSLTIMTPLSAVEYSKSRLRVMDVDGDGYDDISVPDMLPGGDRTIDCWLWVPEEQTYLYAPEYSQVQSDIAADISWKQGKHLISGVRDTPEGGQNLLLWVDGQTISIYEDKREETLITQVQIPEPLSEIAREEVLARSYWECTDRNGDGWGDLQLPYRWEETENGLFVYAHCWLWDAGTNQFSYNNALSSEPII